MHTFLSDDENVKAMRETAREVGLTQLLLDSWRSSGAMPSDVTPLRRALDLLGVSSDELNASSGFMTNDDEVQR
jgi:hypothetical protein